jgi:sulfonate transport system ATP-binding protein
MSFFEIDVEHKHYGGRTILRGLQLRVAKGEIVSLIGASGCGKSSLLGIAAGLDRDAAARVRLDGVEWDVGRSRPGVGNGWGIGMVFQEPRLFPWLTVTENIVFGTGARKLAPGTLDGLLEEVGLAGLDNHLPKQLSGGQAQRVALARALFTQPRVLLLDEPFSAVDAITRIRLQDLLARVALERGLSVLMVTHDIDEAVQLSDRVVLLANGPGPARADVRIDLARPRPRTDARAAAFKSQLLAALDLGLAA